MNENRHEEDNLLERLARSRAGIALAVILVLAGFSTYLLVDRSGAPEQEVADDTEEALADAPDWYRDGARAYERHCAACHQVDGSGSGRNFPPLAEHVPKVLTVEGGREYLIDVILYGIGGEIEVLRQRYRGQMPGFGRISDVEIAALLNYTAFAWGHEDQLPADFRRYEPKEIEARRNRGLAPRDVKVLRDELDLD